MTPCLGLATQVSCLCVWYFRGSPISGLCSTPSLLKGLVVSAEAACSGSARLAFPCRWCAVEYAPATVCEGVRTQESPGGLSTRRARYPRVPADSATQTLRLDPKRSGRCACTSPGFAVVVLLLTAAMSAPSAPGYSVYAGEPESESDVSLIIEDNVRTPGRSSASVNTDAAPSASPSSAAGASQRGEGDDGDDAESGGGTDDESSEDDQNCLYNEHLVAFGVGEFVRLAGARRQHLRPEPRRNNIYNHKQSNVTYTKNVTEKVYHTGLSGTRTTIRCL